jgi:uracil-DNA glycosylase family 4
MELSPDTKRELLALTRGVRAHLEVEAELAAPGFSVCAALPTPAGRKASPPAVASELANATTRATDALRALRAAAASPAPPPTTLEASSGSSASEPGDRRQRLQLLSERVAGCTACVLHEKRNKTAFARGSADAELVFVGEGPGRDEDLQGLPFVGAAGQLLDRMIAAMGYERDAVYICNVVKCRPPENRTPRPEEALACAQYLVPQLEIVAPRAIVALGRCAAQALGVAEATGSWRGRWGSWRGIPILPTYHPAFLLRSPEQKRTVWEDLQQVMARLGRAPAPRPGRG